MLEVEVEVHMPLLGKILVGQMLGLQVLTLTYQHLIFLENHVILDVCPQVKPTDVHAWIVKIKLKRDGLFKMAVVLNGRA